LGASSCITETTDVEIQCLEAASCVICSKAVAKKCLRAGGSVLDAGTIAIERFESRDGIIVARIQEQRFVSVTRVLTTYSVGVERAKASRGIEATGGVIIERL
jgi:hypothetical protein